MVHPLHVGKRIKSLRLKHKLSQASFAEMLFVTHQAVSRWEQGLSLPSIDTLVALTKTFDVSLESLLKEDDALKKEDVRVLLSESDRTVTLLTLAAEKESAKDLVSCIHTLSEEERLIVIRRMLSAKTLPCLDLLFPRLSYSERRVIIMHRLKTNYPEKLTQVFDLLSKQEKRLLKGELR